MKTAELQYDLTALHRFIRTMDSANKFVVKVGIFGNKNVRGLTAPGKAGKSKLRKVFKVPTAMTNAELGAIHELGSISLGIPRRSFLRVPLSIKSKEILKDAFHGAAELMAQGKVRMVLQRLGIACENWIQIAFATRGFGTWLPDNIATIERKGSGEPLIDTAQLRRSITSKVDER